MWDLSRMIRSSDELATIFDAGVAGILDRLQASESADASKFLAAFDRFLFDHGSRGPNEWELSAEV